EIGPVAAALGGLVAGGVALLMFGIGLLVYRRADVFGLGDVKLAAFIGILSGPVHGLWAITAGILVGGVLAVTVLAAQRSRRATMPYGPALAIGAYLVWVLGA